MKLDRTKGAKRNITFGFINKIVTIFFPFIVRTVFIRQLGAEYLGLNSLFTSILTVLNLAELGFSNAIVFSLYKPVAEDDMETIGALLNFYRRVYRFIGIIILGMGLCLMPFLHYFVNVDNCPSDVNLMVIYLIYLANTVLSYYMFAYLTALISAYQREDIISKVNIFISMAMHFIQVISLATTKNYYAYIIIMPVFTIVNNIRTAMIAKKLFPHIKCSGELSLHIKQDIKEKISGLMIQKICGTSRNAFDSIFISAFLGLTQTAMYNNYYYIMNSVAALMAIFTTSVTAGVGNSVAMESVRKNHTDMNKMNFLYMWVSGWCTVCLVCLCQPFMMLWVGETLMFPFGVVLCFCIYFYVLKMGDVRGIYIQASGLWWQMRYRALIESTMNLLLNYVLGKYFGVYGIILATLISLFFINFCYGAAIVYKHYFKGYKVSGFYLSHFKYIFVTAGIGTVTYFICRQILFGGIAGLLLKALLCCLIPNILYFFIYRDTKIYKESAAWIRNISGWKLLDIFKRKAKHS